MAETLSRMHVDHQTLVFRVGQQEHEIDAMPVLEVVTVPHITRVPHGPDALAGIASLRGKPVPILSMRRILGVSSDSDRGDGDRDGKIIVYDHGGVIGLLVDDVLRLTASSTATPLEELNDLLERSFKVSRRGPVGRSAPDTRQDNQRVGGELIALLCFRVAGQHYGLPLDDVREVAVLSGEIVAIPNAASGVVGLVMMRDSVLPIVSLATLLGLSDAHAVGNAARIVVIAHDGDLVGLVVDCMDVIHRLRDDAIETVPALLQRGRGDAEIEAIGRVAQGRLLISILSSEKLFGHHAIAQAIGQNTGARPMGAMPQREDLFEQFLIFALGDEKYGLPIGSVDEVVRVPRDITRVPGAPKFVIGFMNLRGKAIPLIDQHSRFDLTAPVQTAKLRAIIITLGALQAGFIVDAVSEVKAVPAAALSAAPEFSSGHTEVFDRIAHIEADGQMILLINPQELLSRAERDIVSAFTGDTTTVADP